MSELGRLRVRHDRDGADGPAQMAADRALLGEVASQGALLRLYRWEPQTLSLGRFQKADAPDNPVPEAPVVSRPSGGGAIWHHAGCQTFAFAFDRATHPWAGDPLKLYARVNGWLRETSERLQAPLVSRRDCPCEAGPYLCFDRRERTDLIAVVDGEPRKVVGAAQRREAQAVLIHGVIQRAAGALASGAADLEALRGRPLPEPELHDALLATLRAAGWQLDD